MKLPTTDCLTKHLEELAERLSAIGRLTKRLEEFSERLDDPLQAVIERIQAKRRGVPSGVGMVRDAHGGAPGWDDKPPEAMQPDPRPKV